jgi:D-tyrosyl-tRNA(Tyr) deacylase
MRAVIQRVKEASVTVDGSVIGQIKAGMLVFLGVAKTDIELDVEYMVRKISQLRIFEDASGRINFAAEDVKAEFLVVSQFTLLGNCEKGRRPSFDDAADPQRGKELYDRFILGLREKGFKVETGMFRAMMDVALVNDGPVTFVIDS